MELMQSHIIPKLVYTRVKTFQNSRFRNFLDFNQLFQDGEKKPRSGRKLRTIATIIIPKEDIES